MSRLPVVALDGPSASGKSSVGTRAARELGLRFFDTGILYRALSRAALDRGLALTDGPAVAALSPSLDIVTDADGALSVVLVDGVDVTGQIRDGAVDAAVKEVSAQPEVRAAILDGQRQIAADGGIILAGRDIGTVVMPAADAKIWLTASVETRAARRARERGVEPGSPEGRKILADLVERDRADRERPISPSKPADNSVEVNSDDLDFEGTVAAVVAAVRAAAEVSA